VKKVIIRNDYLNNCEWFLACGATTVIHSELYPLVHNYQEKQDPIYLPAWLVRLVLHFKYGMGKITGKIPEERAWMMDYVDKPWIVDNSYTQDKLGWTCSAGKDILSCMPQIIQNSYKYHESWMEHMERRRTRNYEYEK
jgi:hypothetical protein